VNFVDTNVLSLSGTGTETNLYMNSLSSAFKISLIHNQ